MNDILRRRLRPSPDAVESAVGDETVILHLGHGTYYGLDAVGTRIWKMIGQQMAIADVCQQLAEAYDVDLATVQLDARKFLVDLEAQGILVDG